MKTIDYTANGQNVQFSNKTVTIDGQSFAYTGMSAIKHSSAKRLYLFKYEGQWHKLSYNEEDEQKLKTLFSRIAELNAKRAAVAAAKAPEPVPAEPVHKAPEPLDVKSIMESAKGAPAAPVTVAEEYSSYAPPADVIAAALADSTEGVVEPPAAEALAALVEEAQAAEAKAEPVEEAPVVEVPVEPVEEPVAEPVIEEPAEVPEAPAEEISVEQAIEAAIVGIPTGPVEEPAEEVPAEPVEEAPVETAVEVPEAPAEKTPAEPAPEKIIEEAIAGKSVAEETAAETTEAILPPDEKKAKLRKAFTIFAAVIALFIILALVYFFVAGTSSNPTVGPNSDETQQYEDIDGLIEDLQSE